MPRGIRLLHRGLLAIDAAVQSAGPEERSLGTGGIEDVDKLRRVLIWAIVVGESQHARARALGDDDARRRSSTEEVERVGNGESCCGDSQQAHSKGDVSEHGEEYDF